ncbi:hypothetical protein TSUD_261270 [Trifolium subterraneum]|nr:hypothetical protein TSUD_261270 [Trifolium subterraneum]
MYKVLAKVLANRLKLVINKVISETRSAFVKERQIMDGILIANEVVDDAKKQKKEVNSGGSNASSWWKDIISIKCGNDVGGESWFRDNVERKVGDVADMCRSGWGLGGNGFLGVVSRSERRLFCWRGISSVESFDSERLGN